MVRVAVTDLSGGIVLSRALISGPPNLFGGWILEVGDRAAGGNDFGRFGRVAAFRGFEWQGTELLTAGGIAVAGSGRISDGFYTTTLVGRRYWVDMPRSRCAAPGRSRFEH